MMIPSLREVRFRANPYIELKQLAELTAEQREAFRDLESDPDFYGLFVPRPPLMINLKAVARQTAELFRMLSTPSRLDVALCNDDIVDLLLDGILEIESSDGFVSGADACTVVCPSRHEPEPRDATALLSRQALLHAQEVEIVDPRALTAALYLYNRIPLSPFWKARFADGEAILRHLGADRAPLRTLLEHDWIASQTMTGWLYWGSKTILRRSDDHMTYKLYVSPRPEHIRDAFEALVRVLSTFPGTPFKIGDSAVGLLRPDKLVAYFTTREELDESAAALQRELAGCDAHGVPFTAAVDGGGLLSWGVDPPDNERALRWLGRDSWRSWLVQRLGAAMSLAKGARSAGAVEPWRFAIERARRHGIDVETWTPSETLWKAA